MKLVKIEKCEYLKEVHALYQSAFPKNERKPFSMLLRGRKRGVTQFLAILSDEGAFVGLAIMQILGDIALLDYFAIEQKHRSKGYGHEALSGLLSFYSGYRFIGEIEDPDAECKNPSERERRKKFYLSAGMTVTDCKLLVFREQMLLISNGKAVTFEEYKRVLLQSYSKVLRPFVSVKQVRKEA